MLYKLKFIYKKINFYVIIFIIYSQNVICQHTFSIVAVDPSTGEIGSAGATCGDDITWPGSLGARDISDIIPGVGAIHTQSYYSPANQQNARKRMVKGDSPRQIINWLVTNDVNSNPTTRQYGIVDYNRGNPRTAAYTGANCSPYYQHILGDNYAIQGNILINDKILKAMESGFKNTAGCLAEKLMASMQGAKVIGADKRCLEEKTSSLSAFMRVAQPNDPTNRLTLDINISRTSKFIDPIDVLQTKYNEWKIKNTPNDCPKVIISKINDNNSTEVTIFPNPTTDVVHVKTTQQPITKLEVRDLLGNIVLSVKSMASDVNQPFRLSLSNLSKGVYYLSIYQGRNHSTTRKIVLIK